MTGFRTESRVATHRAIVRQEGDIRVTRKPTAVPGPGELSIATEVAGLCGTDIQILRGLREETAGVIGHEGLARVVATGPDVSPELDLTPGTPVVVNPTHPTDPSFLLGHNVDGLLQERTLLPANAVESGMVLPLRDGPEAGLVPLLEPLAVVRYAFDVLSGVGPRTLLVVGDGVVGQLAVRAAQSWLGPSVRTILVHHTDEGLEWSKRQQHTADLLLPEGHPAGLGSDAGPVAALIATPRDATVEALEYVLTTAGTRTTIDLVGGLPPNATSPLLPGVDLVAVRAENCGGFPTPARVVQLSTTAGTEVRLFGHRGVGHHHLRSSATELARDPGRYRELVTHVTDLAGAARVMRHFATSRERSIEGRRLIKLAVRIAP